MTPEEKIEDLVSTLNEIQMLLSRCEFEQVTGVAWIHLRNALHLARAAIARSQS